MKDIKKLSEWLGKIPEKAKVEIKKANEETAEKIWEDIVDIAPMKTGEYISSIKIEDTKVEKNKINTFIGSDLKVTSKEGNSYILGKLLENGTEHHAIPNAFGWGDIFGYDSEMYERTLDENWHPGSSAIPHYSPALENNKDLYKENLKKAIRRAMK